MLLQLLLSGESGLTVNLPLIFRSPRLIFPFSYVFSGGNQHFELISPPLVASLQKGLARLVRYFLKQSFKSTCLYTVVNNPPQGDRGEAFFSSWNGHTCFRWVDQGSYTGWTTKSPVSFAGVDGGVVFYSFLNQDTTSSVLCTSAISCQHTCMSKHVLFHFVVFYL